MSRYPALVNPFGAMPNGVAANKPADECERGFMRPLPFVFEPITVAKPLSTQWQAGRTYPIGFTPDFAHLTQILGA